MKKFRTAKPDRRTRIITIAVLAVLVLGVVGQLIKVNWTVAPIVIIAVVIFIAYAAIPRQIVITDENLTIKGLFTKTIIDLTDIKSVTALSGPGLHLRTFGIGGLFGYFGLFNGGERWSVTHMQKRVAIDLENSRRYVISPENPTEFIEVLRGKINHP